MANIKYAQCKKLTENVSFYEPTSSHRNNSIFVGEFETATSMQIFDVLSIFMA